jgi:hypothetical protein
MRANAEVVSTHPILGWVESAVWRATDDFPLFSGKRTSLSVSRDVSKVPTGDIMRCGKKAVYSITSSAATSRSGGTVKPSDFAVFKFTAVSYLVGACTGRSAGFSPRRMRST